jgi:hypothetical protein
MATERPQSVVVENEVPSVVAPYTSMSCLFEGSTTR